MLAKIDLMEPPAAPTYPPALGPFPRYIWIHQDTPQDSLDKTCHEIWKRVQGLPEGLQPRHQEFPARLSVSAISPIGSTSTLRSSSRSHFNEESLAEMYYKDEISHLVDQEYRSLAKEILNETVGMDFPPEESETATFELYRPAFMGTKLPFESLCMEQKPSVEDMLKSILGNREKEKKIRSDSDFLLSSKSIVPGTCHPEKSTSNSTRVIEESAPRSSASSNKEISHLLAHFSMKQVDSSNAPDNNILMEEARVIKDFLKNSMFSSADHKTTADHQTTAVPLSSTPDKSEEGQAGEQKKQLPVFAKICSNPDSDEGAEDLLSRADDKESVKESKKTKEDGGGLPSQVKAEGSCCCSCCQDISAQTKQNGAPSSNTPNKSVWPPEKPILFPLAGASKSAEGPQPDKNKVQSDVGEQKVPTTAGPDKNNLKYSGHVFTPRTSSSATTQNRPYLLNYPPPPLLPNHSNFAAYQQQGLFQQRPRMPFPQTLHPQLGCFSRQISPYNHQQVAQQLFRSPYTPLMGYIPLVQPDFSFQQRNSPKATNNTRDPPPMAGDGPQFLFPHLFGYNPTPTAPVISSPYFSSAGNGFTAEAFFLGQM